MGVEKREDAVFDGADSGEWSPTPGAGDTQEEPTSGALVGENEFTDDKPTRFDYRPPESLQNVPDEEEKSVKAEEDEVEVPMMSVEDALRAPDPTLAFNDGTEEHVIRALGPTGEGEDEFDSATVPTPEANSELVGLAPAGVDPRSVDPRGPTVLRPAQAAAPPERTEAVRPPGPASRPASPPESRPSWRAAAIERQAPPSRSFQVVNRNSVPPVHMESSSPPAEPPPTLRSSKSVPPPARPSRAPGAARPSYAPNAPRVSLPPAILRLSDSGDLRVQEHVEAAKRTAKILPIAIAGGITIAFVYVAFSGGNLAGVSDEMKEEAAQVYASRAALRSEDKEHAADPLIRIESEPPGARVEVNNVEIGRTPLLAPSPYTNADFFLVVLRDGQEPWHAYLERDPRVSRRIEVNRQRYEGTEPEVRRDKNGIGFVKVTLRAAK